MQLLGDYLRYQFGRVMEHGRDLKDYSRIQHELDGIVRRVRDRDYSSRREFYDLVARANALAAEARALNLRTSGPKVDFTGLKEPYSLETTILDDPRIKWCGIR